MQDLPIRTGASPGLEQDHDGLAGPGLTLYLMDLIDRCLGRSRKDYGGVVRAGVGVGVGRRDLGQELFTNK